MTWNRCQLKKEVRPLLLPWIGAVAAGSLIALRPLVEGEGLETLLTGIVAYGFFGGLALIAAMGFGQELHDRTLSLLLTQPRGRPSVWSQKILIIAVAVATATLVEIGLLTGISNWYSGNELWDALRASFSPADLFMAGCFLVATICSSAYWTLVARSIIGGLVFAVAAQFLSAVGVWLIWAKLSGYDRPFEEPPTFVVLAATTLAYSGILLWLGWRKFTRLELRSSGLGEQSFALSAADRRRVWTRILVCGSTHRILNFVRKELRLLKPIVQLAGVFVLCWIGLVALQWLRREQNISYLFEVITCLYAPVTCLLVGCISLGEEKALGMTTSQLALPFSPWLQWLLKLAVCVVTAVILGLALPVLLFLTTGGRALHESGLINDGGIWAVVCISGLMLLLGYWAITLAPNTLQAALMAIAAGITLPALAGLGIYCGILAVGAGLRGDQVALIWRDTAISAAILLLGQSLFQFRATTSAGSKIFTYSCALAGLVLGMSFLVTCFG
jgi:ABC-type transport system involved in multi-copper enzyme maturation permease subunit